MFWYERRGSNSRQDVGNVLFYHWTTPIYLAEGSRLELEITQSKCVVITISLTPNNSSSLLYTGNTTRFSEVSRTPTVVRLLTDYVVGPKVGLFGIFTIFICFATSVFGHTLSVIPIAIYTSFQGWIHSKHINMVGLHGIEPCFTG